jgi:hypothetical protein
MAVEMLPLRLLCSGNSYCRNLVNAWKHWCRHADSVTSVTYVAAVVCWNPWENFTHETGRILFLFCYADWGSPPLLQLEQKTCALATASSEPCEAELPLDLAAVHSWGRMGTCECSEWHQHSHGHTAILPVLQGRCIRLSVEQWVALGAEKCCSGQQETEGGSWIWLLFLFSPCFLAFISSDLMSRSCLGCLQSEDHDLSHKTCVMDGPASQQWQKKVDMVAMVSVQRTSLLLASWLFPSSQPAMSLYLSSLIWLLV